MEAWPRKGLPSRGLPITMNNLNKFLSASVRRCFRKFLKNTGRFQPCPLDVLKSFLKTQGGFRAARWVLFVAGRFHLSADSRFRFQLFASTTLNHKLKTVFPSTGATNPFAFSGVLWSGFFRVSEPKTDFDEQHLSRNFSGCDLSEQNGTVCGQEFFANSW